MKLGRILHITCAIVLAIILIFLLLELILFPNIKTFVVFIFTILALSIAIRETLFYKSIISYKNKKDSDNYNCKDNNP